MLTFLFADFNFYYLSWCIYFMSCYAQGFAIGNGLTDPLVQYKAYTDYALDMGLIKESDYKNINRRLPGCELAIKLCGTDGTTACMAAYLACNTIFSSIKSIAGNINVNKSYLILHF